MMSSSKNSRPVSLALLLAAVILMAANLRSPLVALGPVVPFIQDSLGVSASYIGLIAAAPMAVFAAFSPAAVWAAKKWGMAQVLPWSLALMAAGLALRITGPSVNFLLLGTVVLSMAIAAGNVLLPALAKRNLPSRIGLVVGTLSATMSVSAALASALAVPLAQWGGWRWSLGIWLLTALAAFAVWFSLRKRLAAAPTAAEASGSGVAVWRSPQAWMISVFMGVQSLAFYSLVNFLPSVLQAKGLSALASGNYMSLFQISSLLGVLAVSAWFGKSGNRPLFSVAVSALMFAGVAGLWLSPAAWAWFWVVLAGIGGSGTFSMVLMLFALRTGNSSEAAALSGMAQAVGYAIAILGPLGMGMLYDLTASWAVPMGLLSALLAAECLLAWWVAQPKTLSEYDRKSRAC